jgi:glycosyltransferase involved in cell wall biosynthesis
VTRDPIKTTSDLAIIGGLPPPYGGVSIHLKRLLAHLDREGINYHLYDTGERDRASERITPVGRRGSKWFLGYLLRAREPVIFVHSSRWDIWAATWWLSRVRGKAVILAIHTDSLRRLWPRRSRLAKRAVAAAFRAARAIMAVNSHVRDFLDEVAGVGGKTVVIPAFVEPLGAAGEQAALQPEVLSFCQSHHPVILANGAPILYDDGRDLYGIDMAVQLIDRLRSHWPQIGLVWYLLKFSGWSPAYLAQMADEIRRRGIESHWLFVEPVGEMYPIFRNVDLFVRPTCSDGDAVSIRESLYFRVPAIASDAAPRPEGTVIFGTRDQEDFTQRVRAALESLDEQRGKLATLPTGSAVRVEIDLLRRVINEVRRNG